MSGEFPSEVCYRHLFVVYQTVVECVPLYLYPDMYQTVVECVPLYLYPDMYQTVVECVPLYLYPSTVVAQYPVEP